MKELKDVRAVKCAPWWWILVTWAFLSCSYPWCTGESSSELFSPADFFGKETPRHVVRSSLKELKLRVSSVGDNLDDSLRQIPILKVRDFSYLCDLMEMMGEEILQDPERPTASPSVNTEIRKGRFGSSLRTSLGRALGCRNCSV